MAIFPDRIILKNTTDLDAVLVEEASPQGSQPLNTGELVIRRDTGYWELYSLTADNLLVSLTTGLLERSSLDDLQDVNISIAPTPLSVLTWTGTAWEDRVAPPFTLNGNVLTDLGDVSLGQTTGEAQSLVYSADLGSWTNEFVNLLSLQGVAEPEFTKSAGNGTVLVWDVEENTQDPESEDDFGYTWRNLKQTEIVNDLNYISDIQGESLGDLGDVRIDQDNEPTQGDVLSYDQNEELWVLTPQGVPDLSQGSITDLGDVVYDSQDPIPDKSVVIYSSNDQNFFVKPLQAADIPGLPTNLSDLINDLTVSSFPNDANYLSGLAGSSIGDMGDVVLTGLASGDVLAYDGTAWVNAAAPPADISGSSIRDLNDVTVANGLVKISNSSGFDYSTVEAINAGQGLYIEAKEDKLELVAARLADDQGVRVSMSRQEGIAFKSDVETFRLLGNPNVISNTPQLVFHSGTTEEGSAIAIKLPLTGITQDFTYLLPQSPGATGQVLAMNGDTGQTYWVDSQSSSELGDLSNVDLNTFPPINNDVLTYNAASGQWLSLPQATDLSSQSVGALLDVNYATTPTQGQALLWNNPAQEWQPGNITYDGPETVEELNDVNYVNPPQQGQTLIYSGVEWIPGAVPATVTSLSLVGDVDYVESELQAGDVLSFDTSTLTWVNTIIDLEFISDVDLSTDPPEGGQVLTWDGTSGKWIPTNKTLLLNELNDVDLNTNQPQDGDYLGWDSNLNAFTPLPVDSSSISLNDLTDVDLSSNAPSNNDLLRYDLIAGEWVAYTPPVTPVVISQPIEPTIRPDGNNLVNGDLWWKTDTDQLFVYESGVWETPGAGSIDSLSDVDTSTTPPTDGQVLVWNQSLSNWIPSEQTAGGSLEAGGAYLEETIIIFGGESTLTNLGYSGILQKVSSTITAWVTLYTTALARTQDASREFDTDPDPGSGVLAEFLIAGGETEFATPGTTYLNNDTPSAEAIYVAYRDTDGNGLDGSITVSAYGIATITAVRGGTFGSGI
jgi:hypothetical protein